VRQSGSPVVGYRRGVDEAVAPTDPGAPEQGGSSVGSQAPDESTGVASVDAALARLRDLDGAAVEAHVEIFDDVQRQLHDALAELADGQ
jgi:poly(3-hydroxybutyrate) depolymerase